MANKFLDDNGLLYFWQKIVNKIIGNIVNDLTSTAADKSLSAAQGKVLDEKIAAINTNMENLGGGDMLKSKYDVDNNGQVDKADDADKLGGQLPNYYAPASALNGYVATEKVGQAGGVASLNSDGKVPTSQLPETAPIEHTHEMSDINGLAEASEQLTSAFEEAVEEMTEVANGKCTSYVFETEADLDAALTEYKAFMADSTPMSETNVLNGVTLKIGDVFLIKEVKVPDYWWSGTDKAVLETTKVDITTISNAEIDTIVAS